MTQDDWNDLLSALRNHECVLMLGPEIGVENVKGEAKSFAAQLAEELIDKIENKNILDPNNFVHVAQQYKIENSKYQLKNKVISFYQGKGNYQSEIHSHLAALPFQLVISSTHDNLLGSMLIGWEK